MRPRRGSLRASLIGPALAHQRDAEPKLIRVIAVNYKCSVTTPSEIGVKPTFTCCSPPASTVKAPVGEKSLKAELPSFVIGSTLSEALPTFLMVTVFARELPRRTSPKLRAVGLTSMSGTDGLSQSMAEDFAKRSASSSR